MTTLDGERTTVISALRRDDEWIVVNYKDGRSARVRLWYLREVLEKHAYQVKKVKSEESNPI